MRAAIPALACLFALAGCQNSKSPPASAAVHPSVEVPTDPAERLREQLRSGAVQLESAVEPLEGASRAAAELRGAKGVPQNLKSGMKDAADLFDGVRVSIQGFTAEPKPLAEFRKDLMSGEKRRVDAVEACTDALHDLADAQGILGSLSDSAPGKFQNPLEDVDGHLDEAKDAIEGALGALGGPQERP